MFNSNGSLYPKSDHLPLWVEKLLNEAKEQFKDNKGALYPRLQAIALQVTDHPVKDDLLAVLVECFHIPNSMITDAFAIGSEQLMETRNAEPISICSCLHCKSCLPENNRQVLLRQLRALSYLPGRCRRSYRS